MNWIFYSSLPAGTEDGKLTAEQFINFMNQFAFDSAGADSSAGGSGMFIGLPALIICRFIDRFVCY